MSEYADMAIERDLNDYMDSQFNIRNNSCFGNEDENDNDNDIDGVVIQSPYTTNSPKIDLITKDNDYLLRSFKCNMNMVVKCIKVTNKAVLFQCTDETYTKLSNKLFWVPKSIININKNDLPQAQIYYLPNWATIKPIN